MAGRAGRSDKAGGQTGKAERSRTLGDYVLGRVIVERGTLATYAAEGVTVKRTALVRSSAPSVALGDRARKHLLREAELLARAAGDGVALLLEVAPDGAFYAVEDPRGPHLAELLERVRDGKIELAPEAAIALVGAIVSSVATVHEAGVVHGGIEPAAFFVSSRRRLVLLGFDRARREDAPVDPEEAERGAPAIDHDAPETLLGEPPSFASDVFSIGVVAYELLAGAHPFVPADAAAGKKPADVARRIRTERAPAIAASRGVPIDLERLVQRCLGKEPGHRPKNAIDLAAEIATIKLPESRDAELAKLYAKLGIVDRKPRPMTAVEVEESEAAPRDASFRQIALRLGVLFAMMVAVGGAIQMASRSGGDDEKSAPAGSGPGYVRVLAHPWAEVWIDGSEVDTTPVGNPIELPSGRHTFVFKHPRAPDESRVVDVAPNATSTLDVAMRVQRAPVDAGVDASP